MARTDFRRLGITDPRLLAALGGVERLTRTPESIASEDIPGLMPGIVSAASTAVVPTRGELGARADLARAREARRARAESTRVDPAELGREIGALTGSETLGGVLEGMGSVLPEYDPLALGTSFNPLTDEIIAGAESLAGDTPYRERQAELEQRFAEAQQRSPGSTVLGTLGQAAATGPLLASLTAGTGAAVGAGLGGAGGYLGSEGGTGTDRALATLGGALAGGSLGTLAGVGTEAGALLRGAPGVLRHTAGTALESGAGSLGLGALQSEGRIGDRQLIEDALRAGGMGIPAGAVPGLVSGVASRTAPAIERMATPRPTRARETTPVDVQEAVLELPDLVEAPDVPIGASPTPDFDPRAIAESVQVDPAATLFAADPDIERLVAAGAIDRGTINRLALAFGGGPRGIARAAEVARTTGISTPGRRSTLGEAYNRTAAVRDASRDYLSAHHARAAGRGAAYSGDAVADDLERLAAELDIEGAPPAMRARANEYRAAAMRYRYGNETQLRREAERILGAEDITGAVRLQPAAPPPVPGLAADASEMYGPLEREVVAQPLREAMPRGRDIPYDEARVLERDVLRRGKIFNKANPPTTAADQILADEYTALSRERPRAAARVLPEEMENVRRANEAFRLAETIAPSDRVGAAPIGRTGVIRAAFGRGAEGNLVTGVGRGFLERMFSQIEPSMVADLAEGGAPVVRRALASLGRGARRTVDLAGGTVPTVAAGAAARAVDAPRSGAASEVARRADLEEQRMQAVQSDDYGWGSVTRSDVGEDDEGWGSVETLDDDENAQQRRRTP